MIQPLKLTCYVCGNPLGATFYLASSRTETDRIFTVCPESCVRLLDGETSVLKVTRRQS